MPFAIFAKIPLLIHNLTAIGSAFSSTKPTIKLLTCRLVPILKLIILKVAIYKYSRLSIIIFNAFTPKIRHKKKPTTGFFYIINL